jgi:hypothetical protein
VQQASASGATGLTVSLRATWCCRPLLLLLLLVTLLVTLLLLLLPEQ